jgi:hypothetical protein
MSTEIERTTDLQKVLEGRILDSKVELSLREVLEDRQEGGPQLQRKFGELEKAFDGAGAATAQASRGADDVPRRYGHGG